MIDKRVEIFFLFELLFRIGKKLSNIIISTDSQGFFISTRGERKEKNHDNAVIIQKQPWNIASEYALLLNFHFSFFGRHFFFLLYYIKYDNNE